MKVSDFKLLATLPDGYDYRIYPHANNDLLIVGNKGSNYIFYVIATNKLFPLSINNYDSI